MTSGALRFIICMTLALPALLLSEYTLSQFAQSPDSLELAQTTIILIGLGFTFLLALAPFHSWVPSVAREAPPLSTAIILNILFGAVWFVMLDMLHENILISEHPDIPALLRGAGVLMAVVGGALSWPQRDFGRLLGYGALADMGAMLYGVGIGTSAALAASFIVLIMRSVSVVLMSMGMTLARERHGDDSFATLRGLVWRMPFAALAIVVGGLSLAGFPPFAGFAGRWGIVQQMSFTDIRAALVMLAASISVAVGVLRGLREMLGAAESDQGDAPIEGRGERVLIIAGIGLCALVGLFPGVFAQFVQAFAIAYQ
jgi:formate hydrogenlyase subunit 3/multisubunit Na+/H+ antiporter MnhD subunit